MTRALAAAVLAASASAAAIMSIKDTPAEPPRPHLADDIPRPSGRRHVNECPLRYGIGTDVETAWR